MILKLHSPITREDLWHTQTGDAGFVLVAPHLVVRITFLNAESLAIDVVVYCTRDPLGPKNPNDSAAWRKCGYNHLRLPKSLRTVDVFAYEVVHTDWGQANKLISYLRNLKKLKLPAPNITKALTPL